MQIVKLICLLGPILGFLLIPLPSLMSMSGEVTSIISAASAVLVAIGSFFFAYIKQSEKIEKLYHKNQRELKVLKAQLEATGQDFLIKQYADDLIEAALVQDTLKDIHEYANNEPMNAAAIKQGLLGINRIQFKGFLAKAGELLNATNGVELLDNFLSHLESVLKTRSQIPVSLAQQINDLRDLVERRKQKMIDLVTP